MKEYNKICLLCRKEFVAQKRTTKYCGHTCASRAYKITKREQGLSELSFEEFVKGELLKQTDIIIQLQATMSMLIDSEKIHKLDYITPSDYCRIKGISKKTLSRWIKSNQVEYKKISQRKYLIKS